RVLVVARPLALAAARHRAVDHAVARNGAVAEHVHHQRHALARGKLEARAHALTGALVPGLAVHAVTVVVVEATHRDTAGAGEAFDHELHDGSRLAEFLAVGSCVVEFRLAEDSRGPDNEP